MFDVVLGMESIPENRKIITRTAVRGVIFTKDNKIAMIYNNYGDYKLAGGGIEDGESHMLALKREVLEETGIEIDDEIQKVGLITEISNDLYVEGAIFVMYSYFYSCKVKKYTNNTNLDGYEKEHQYTLKEIDIYKAYEHNKKLLEENENCSPWLYREVITLENIIKNIDKLK